jgi:hypothetical protein
MASAHVDDVIMCTCTCNEHQLKYKKTPRQASVGTKFCFFNSAPADVSLAGLAYIDLISTYNVLLSLCRSEPWLIVARTLVPWHDMRYRGFGKDKVQFVENLGALKFKFMVLHDAFVIHR